jgi:hypothetical protein
MPRRRQIARYRVMFGLAGCYMPDSSGTYEWATRKDMAEGIRELLRMYDLPVIRRGAYPPPLEIHRQERQ